jgi:chitin synthase
LEDQFRNLGFTDLEISAVWRVTAAVLHVGEVRFEDSTYDENGKPCTVVNMDKMNKVAKLLGID